jgi:hypothetical protein
LPEVHCLERRRFHKLARHRHRAITLNRKLRQKFSVRGDVFRPSKIFLRKRRESGTRIIAGPAKRGIKVQKTAENRAFLDV